MAHILVVEDEEGLAHNLMLSLQHHGHRAHWVTSAELARAYLIQESSVELMLLDWMLPAQNGVSLISSLRQHLQWESLPILMLTARSGEQDKVAGLTAGADDYLCKPFSMKELQARILALLRRRSNDHAPSQILSPSLKLGCLHINPAQREVILGEKKLVLTDLEFCLLDYLARHLRVVSRQELLDTVWDKYVEERTVDATIKRLRQALISVGFQNKITSTVMIETVRGVGYRLIVQDMSP